MASEVRASMGVSDKPDGSDRRQHASVTTEVVDLRSIRHWHFAFIGPRWRASVAARVPVRAMHSGD